MIVSTRLEVARDCDDYLVNAGLRHEMFLGRGQCTMFVLLPIPRFV